MKEREQTTTMRFSETFRVMILTEGFDEEDKLDAIADTLEGVISKLRAGHRDFPYMLSDKSGNIVGYADLGLEVK